MRNLTIKRHKSFVASLIKMKVYIEDRQSGDLVINDVPCRKLGDLKNGEEKTFQISQDAGKVFVIADKLSKNYCNEFYEFPAGAEDIYLTGKNKYNPANGNAFRFDYNDSQAVVEHRKKGMRKGIIILICAGIIGALAGYFITSGILGDKSDETKIFDNSGMKITLNEDFKKFEQSGFSAAYESKDVVVLALQEKFTLLKGFENYTLKEYANAVIKNNKLTSVNPETKDGLTSFEYDASVDGETYHYVAYVFKTDDAFWMVQFATTKDNAENYASKIEEWAKTIEFAK